MRMTAPPTHRDTIFALATGRTEARLHPVALGAAVAAVTAAAVLRAVRAARGLSGPGLPTVPSLAEFLVGGGR